MSLWSRIGRQLGDLAGDLLADETRLALSSAREQLDSNPAAVIATANQVLEQHPDHPLALALLGAAHLELGEASTASDCFERALAIDAELTEALLGRGEAALILGRAEDAVTPFHRAIDCAGGDRKLLAEAYRGLGVAYRRLGESDKAIRELRKAVAEDSDDRFARAALGEALVAVGNNEEARRHLRRATTGEVAPSMATVALGRLALAEGDTDSAREMFRSAEMQVEASSVFAAAPFEIQLGLGDAAAMEGELGDALEHYQAACAANPRSAESHAKLGDLHCQREDFPAAIACYSRSLELAGSHEVLQRATLAAIRGGNNERRVDLANRLLAMDATNAAAIVARAMVLADEGDIEAARASMRAAVRSDRDGVALFALAELDLADGRLEEAAAGALATLRLRPNHERARELLAEARSRQLSSRSSAVDPRHVTKTGDAMLYQSALELADLLGGRPELAQLAAEPASAATDFDRPLLITVMGEFSSGKSSFVNAFIGEDIAPTGITPTTATINVVKYGRERGGRVIAQDGSTEALSWPQLSDKLRELTGPAAMRIAQVEIMLPQEELERVHLVDTPGLNSILPEHEAVARDFIARADAVVWVFSAAQAGKKSERQALSTIKAQGKRVLGVVNKADQLDQSEIAAVCDHLAAELGDLVDVVVPVSARNALEAKARGDGASEDFVTLERELENRFFARARQLKRQALDRRLRSAIERATAKLHSARRSGDAASTALRKQAERITGELEQFLEHTVDRERSAMQEEVRELFGAAAREILDLVRPRRLPFGSHQATPADRDYLIGLLEAGYDRVIGAGEARIVRELERIGSEARNAIAALEEGSLGDAIGDIDRATADTTRWVRAQVFGRTASYVRGYLRGGYVSQFFRRDLPKIELNEQTIFQALYHSSPDLDAEIAVPLARAVAEALTGVAERLDHLSAIAALHGFDLDVGILRALQDVEKRRQAIAAGEYDQTEADPGD